MAASCMQVFSIQMQFSIATLIDCVAKYLKQYDIQILHNGSFEVNAEYYFINLHEMTLT